MEEIPIVTGNCNGNSPLVWNETMLAAMRSFARRNQPVLCSPFVLGGANTPASRAPMRPGSSPTPVRGGTEQSITEIAMAWCFRSTSYFSKMFRRRFSHSPGAHRPMYFSAAVAPALAERFSLSDSPVREG